MLIIYNQQKQFHDEQHAHAQAHIYMREDKSILSMYALFCNDR